MASQEKAEKNYRMIFVLAAAIIIIGLVFFKKPAITGRVIGGQQAIYSENLNIAKNGNGSYIWQVKNPGDMKSLKVTGSVTANGSAKIYVENNGTKYLLFDSSRQLFDVNVQVLPDYKKVFQGNEILIQIALLNLRGFGSGNVNVKYSIKDARGNLIASQQEPVFVETQAKFIRKLEMPAEIAPGTYVAAVEASTKVVVGSGSDTFEVLSKYEYERQKEIRYYLIGLAALVALAIIFVLAVRGLKALKKKKEIIELREKMPMERARKLKGELRALEDAYKSGFISQESYKKEKERIGKKLEQGK